MSTPNPQNDLSYATEYLRRLLAEDTVEAPDPSRLNGLATPFEAMFQAKQTHGTEGAKRVYEAFANNMPALKRLSANQKKRFYHADELHLLPRPEYLPGAEPLYKGCMNMLVGQTGAGKSFYALHLALTVAQYAPVIYIAAEGAAGYHDRIDAWKIANGFSSGKLFFAPEELQIVSAESVLEFVQGVQGFLDSVQHLLPQLVIIDTLARCFGSGDENSAEDMGIYIRGVGTIQHALNTATLSVHHTTKTGHTERGSGALRSACDSVIDLFDEDGVIKVVNSKNKYGKELDDVRYRLVDFQVEEGRTCPALQGVEKVIEVEGQPLTKQQYTVLESLSMEVFRDSGAKSATLIKMTNINENSMYRVLSKLKKKGYVSQSAKGDPFFITAEGRKAIGQ